MEEDYPRSSVEFEHRFATDAACLDYLAYLRWGDSFSCPKCGSTEFWYMMQQLRCCRACRLQTSVTSGTIFHGARKPLTLWFKAMWYITTSLMVDRHPRATLKSDNGPSLEDEYDIIG